MEVMRSTEKLRIPAAKNIQAAVDCIRSAVRTDSVRLEEVDIADVDMVSVLKQE